MAVQIDTVGPSSAGTGITSGTSLNWSHTCNGANRFVVVGVTAGLQTGSDAGLSLGVTYGGIAMTSAAMRHSFDQTAGFAQLFYMIAPPSGTSTVAVTLSGGTADLTGGSVSFNGVDQSMPFGTVYTSIGNDTTPTITVPNTTSGNIILDTVGDGSAILANTQTLQWEKNLNYLSGCGNGAQSTTAGGGSVTSSYSSSSDWWVVIAMEIFASGPGARTAWLRA